MCWVTPNPIPEPVRPYPDDEWTYFAPPEGMPVMPLHRFKDADWHPLAYPRIKTDKPGPVVPKEKVMPPKIVIKPTIRRCVVCRAFFHENDPGATISLASSINNRNKGRESHDYDLYLCEKCVGLGLADRLDKLVIDTMKAQAGYWEGAGQGGE